MTWNQRRTVHIHLTASLSLLLSLQFPLLISFNWFKCNSFVSLSTTSFHVIMSGYLSLCIFSPSHHHHPFLKCVHSVSLCHFYCLLFLASAYASSLSLNFTPHIYHKISTTNHTYKPHPQIWGQYAGKILVAINKLYRYFADIIKSVG